MKTPNDIAPSASDLRIAPLLKNWRVIVQFGATRLRGEVIDHPELFDQRISTSPLLVINESEKWARTQTRFYNLGEPAFKPPTEFDVALYKKRLEELSERELHHGSYDLRDYPTIARVVARRSTTRRLDGRAILTIMETAHPIDVAGMTKAEADLVARLRVKRDGMAF